MEFFGTVSINRSNLGIINFTTIVHKNKEDVIHDMHDFIITILKNDLSIMFNIDEIIEFLHKHSDEPIIRIIGNLDNTITVSSCVHSVNTEIW